MAPCDSALPTSNHEGTGHGRDVRQKKSKNKNRTQQNRTSTKNKNAKNHTKDKNENITAMNNKKKHAQNTNGNIENVNHIDMVNSSSPEQTKVEDDARSLGSQVTSSSTSEIIIIPRECLVVLDDKAATIQSNEQELDNMQTITEKCEEGHQQQRGKQMFQCYILICCFVIVLLLASLLAVVILHAHDGSSSSLSSSSSSSSSSSTSFLRGRGKNHNNRMDNTSRDFFPSDSGEASNHQYYDQGATNDNFYDYYVDSESQGDSTTRTDGSD